MADKSYFFDVYALVDGGKLKKIDTLNMHFNDELSIYKRKSVRESAALSNARNNYFYGPDVRVHSVKEKNASRTLKNPAKKAAKKKAPSPAQIAARTAFGERAKERARDKTKVKPAKRKPGPRLKSGWVIRFERKNGESPAYWQRPGALTTLLSAAKIFASEQKANGAALRLHKESAQNIRALGFVRSVTVKV